ncbi:MAG: glycoside hydrolase family 3 N-terminal domain-containing protein [Acidobacteriota bacterium]
MPRTLLLGSCLFMMLGLLAACDSGSAPEISDDPTSGTSAPKEESATPSLTRFDPQVDELLAKMTLEEKVGQMTQADQDYLVEPSDIQTYFLGSLLSGGDSDPSEENTFEDWRAMLNGYHELALGTRLGIPLLYGIDAVHGNNNVAGAVIFPHNIGLGAAGDPDLVERVYRATAVETRAIGANWNFAPALSVPRDERWGRTYEGFSEDPELVAILGRAAVVGLQGDDLSAPDSILGSAKHFAGDGGTVFGTGLLKDDGSRWPMDRGDVQLSEAELRRIHMPAYPATIGAGVGTIMPSFSSWNGEKCSGSKQLLTDILKVEMGFEGFLISDWAALDELPGDYASDIEQSINAGMDMVMVPDKYREFYDTLKGLVEEGRIPMTRIDDAVRRILRVKIAMGMLDEGYSPLADPALEEHFGSDAHRELGREAVRESLVLLKNEGALPLAKDAGRIHVAGAAADDLDKQCGGWTITWQGKGSATEGTTVLEGIRQAVGEGTEVTYSADGSGAAGADAVIVVIGEEPYAEMEGDREDISISAQDAAAVARAAEAGIPVVTVLLSGRPMVLGESLDQSAAYVAAWLPGTEGAGVADVLFGDHPPSGKLTFSWPRSTDQLPINRGDAEYDPQWPYGYGLTY